MTYDPDRIPDHVPHYREPAPHYHRDRVYIGNSGPSRETLSIRQVTIPILLVVFGAVFLVGVTYAGTRELSDIKYSINNLRDDIQRLTGELSRRVDRIEADAKDRWTANDHDVWCARTEQMNADIKWRCAPLTSSMQRRRFGWRPSQPTQQ